jgi:DNA repair protein RecO
MLYKKLEGIVLKQTNYREADRIVTIWTKEEGRIRVLAKSVRLSKSKLSYSLQDLSYIQFETSGKRLSIIINVKLIRNFQHLRENLKTATLGIFLKELMLKVTVDSQPNHDVYQLFLSALNYLNSSNEKLNIFEAGLSFAIKLLKFQGFYQSENLKKTLGRADQSVLLILKDLETQEFSSLKLLSPEKYKAIERYVKNILEYIIEREIKSLDYLPR